MAAHPPPFPPFPAAPLHPHASQMEDLPHPPPSLTPLPPSMAQPPFAAHHGPLHLDGQPAPVPLDFDEGRATAAAAAAPGSGSASNRVLSEREAIAEEALMKSIQHVVQQYVRQDIQQQLNIGDDGMPRGGAAAAPAAVMEFHAGSPRHSLKIGILLFAAFFGIAPLLNTITCTMVIGGAISVYIADFLGYRKGSILVLLVALVSFSASLVITYLLASGTSVGAIAMLLNIMGLVCVSAAQAITHYHWIQVTFPELTCFLERFSLAVAPLMSIPSVLATIIAFAGARLAPFPLAASLCVIHHYFATISPSSFLFEMRTVRIDAPEAREGDAEDGLNNAGGEEAVVAAPLPATERDEAIVMTLATLLIPVVTYGALQSNAWVDTPLPHVLNAVALVGIPVTYLFRNPRKSLWFLRAQAADKFGSYLAESLEHDPLGLWQIVLATRGYVLGLGYLMVVHWAVYRILHSRYQYFFVGVPPPFNGLALLFAAYCATAIALLAKTVLDADATGKSIKTASFTTSRILIMLLSVAFAILVAIAAGMPQFFYPMSALTASSFNAFLIDRRNQSNFTMFCMTSSLLLMWWMYRSFSFINMDLTVFGEATTVPTPVVAVSVLWAYLVGCIAFGTSFAENKSMTQLMMVVLALKVGWLEHVLYSQKDIGSYPAVLVLLTSGVGTAVSIRMLHNGIMTPGSAAIAGGAFLAKVYTYVVEMTSAEYALDGAAYDSNGARALRAAATAVGWLGALLCFSTVLNLEFEIAAKLKRSAIAPAVVTFVAGLAIALLCAIPVLRSFLEFLTNRWEPLAVESHGLVGLGVAVLSLVTMLFLHRLNRIYTEVHAWTAPCRSGLLIGIVFFVLRPTSILMTPVGTGDYEVLDAKTGRILALIGFTLAAVGAFLPLSKVSMVARQAYWLLAVLLCTLGMTTLLIPTANVAVVASTGCMIFFSILTIDVCHYRTLAKYEAWVIYAVSVFSMVVSFVALGRSDLKRVAGDNIALMWELHENGRMLLLAFSSCTSLFMAIVLRMRLAGQSLFPRPLQMTEDMVQQVGLIGNYSTLLTCVTSSILNFWAGDGSPVVYIAVSFFLLLLCDDEMLFFALSNKSFRYFPVMLYACLSLWASHGMDSYVMATEKGWKDGLKTALYGLPVLPSHVSLLTLLYFGRSRVGLPALVVVVMGVLDVLCLILSPYPLVQWMAVVGIVGQLTRLYDAQFWRKSHVVL